jgi:hypothetical protein
MSIYNNYITYDKIISPINGYSTGRITKNNIKNFGFASVDELNSLYPDFPTVAQSYFDRQKEKSIERQTKKISDYYNNPKQCKECLNNISYEKRGCAFCSQSCAATHTNKNKGPRNKNTKNKISESVKLFYHLNPDYHKTKTKPVVFRKKQIEKKNCTICNVLHDKRGNTCSKKCFGEQQRKNALIQEKHGGGKKGRYKNIPCDSSWELAFLIYHLDNGANITRCKEKRNYIIDGKTYTYIPDFVIDDKIYEIKGYMSERAKIKLQYNQDIILIDKTSIFKYIKYVKEKYNVKDVTYLYE